MRSRHSLGPASGPDRYVLWEGKSGPPLPPTCVTRVWVRTKPRDCLTVVPTTKTVTQRLKNCWVMPYYGYFEPKGQSDDASINSTWIYIGTHDLLRFWTLSDTWKYYLQTTPTIVWQGASKAPALFKLGFPRPSWESHTQPPIPLLPRPGNPTASNAINPITHCFYVSPIFHRFLCWILITIFTCKC